MAFDSAIISYTTKTDKVDLVQAAHMNAVQAELVTIETILGTNVKGDRADLKTRLNNALDGDGSLLSGTAYPSPSLPSQAFYKTDADTFYIRNAANDTWLAQGGSLSNVLFSFALGGGSHSANVNGVIVNDDITAGANIMPAVWAVYSNQTYGIVLTTKWKKISGVSTVTIYANVWGFGVGTQANIKVDIGSANNNVDGTEGQTSPEWLTFTIDVSGLTNGTVYDVTVSLKNLESGSYLTRMDSIIAFGS